MVYSDILKPAYKEESTITAVCISTILNLAVLFLKLFFARYCQFAHNIFPLSIRHFVIRTKFLFTTHILISSIPNKT